MYLPHYFGRNLPFYFLPILPLLFSLPAAAAGASLTVYLPRNFAVQACAID